MVIEHLRLTEESINTAMHHGENVIDVLDQDSKEYF
jgi:hypothetical protein